MELVSYLKQIYGYDTPIFIKDVRIGRKSKTAIREEFYRAAKRGELERKANGIYFIRSDKEFGSGISFMDIIEDKFIYSEQCNPLFKDLFIEGYYSGQTFLNKIGISQQVPAILEITTNRTSSKKRLFVSGNFSAIIRKARTEVTFQNYKALQFFDMFHFLTMDEVKENKDLIVNYIKKNKISKFDFETYIRFYGTDTIKKIVEGGIINAFIQ